MNVIFCEHDGSETSTESGDVHAIWSVYEKVSVAVVAAAATAAVAAAVNFVSGIDAFADLVIESHGAVPAFCLENVNDSVSPSVVSPFHETGFGAPGGGHWESSCKIVPRSCVPSAHRGSSLPRCLACCL